MQERIKFSKYQGAGNDFILVDNRKHTFDTQNGTLIKKLCERRFGIGADGLMLLQDSNQADFEMIYYNADGQPSSMCGNGGRCIVAYARDLKIIDTKADFLAVDGKHHAQINDDIVELSMIDVLSYERDNDAYILYTGSPHYVQKVSKLEQFDVYNKGQFIRYSERYKENGINVNFIEDQGNSYFLRTYERGVENETLACGTGATAAAISIALEEDRRGEQEIFIRVRGGMLSISFKRQKDVFTDVRLKGLATHVFDGEIML